MPEHVHLLVSEPERGTPSTVMQVVKQRYARRVLREQRSNVPLGQGRLWGGLAQVCLPWAPPQNRLPHAS